MSKKSMFLVFIAIVTFGLMFADPATDKANHTAFMWHCSDMSVTDNGEGLYTVVASGGAAYWRIVDSGGAEVVEPQTSSTFSNVSLGAGDYQVQAADGKNGPWTQSGCTFTIDKSPETLHNTASLTVEPSCENLNAVVTVTYSEGGSSDHGDSFTVGMLDSAQNIDVVVSFSSGEPLSIPLKANIQSKEGCLQPDVNTASSTVKYDCKLNVATIDVLASEGGKVQPTNHLVVTLTNVQQTFEFHASFDNGEPSNIDVKVVVLELKKACSETKTTPPGEPDQGYCLVGNGMNVTEGTSGGFRGGWWLAAMHPMPTGKMALAIEMHFADYKNRHNKIIHIASGVGSQDVLVKTLDAPLQDRCDISGDPIAIPFTTPQPLIMDEGAAGWMHGIVAGTAVVDGKSFSVEKFNPDGTVSQASGVMAWVKTTGRSLFGFHETDVQRKLEIGEKITILGVTYEVVDSWEIQKYELESLPKGTYAISCTSDLVRNIVYKLKKAK